MIILTPRRAPGPNALRCWSVVLVKPVELAFSTSSEGIEHSPAREPNPAPAVQKAWPRSGLRSHLRSPHESHTPSASFRLTVLGCGQNATGRKLNNFTWIFSCRSRTKVSVELSSLRRNIVEYGNCRVYVYAEL
jgi:hypothetical protein